MGLGYFLLNGESSLDCGIIIESKNIYGAPERDFSRVEVPGRNGDLLLDNGRFRNREVSYTCTIKPQAGQTLSDAAKAIKVRLLKDGIAYRTLSDSYEPDYFRMASYNAALDVEQWAIILGRAEIVFDCEPERYSFAGQNPVTLDAPGSITNPEAFAALPLIKVNGSGAGNLYVGDAIITIAAIDGHIAIDSKAMNAYKDTTNQNGVITLNSAGFPRLGTGETAISWDGGITSLDIIPRWWTI